MRPITKAIHAFLFTCVLSRPLLKLMFGDAFSDPKFATPLLWKCAFIQKILRINSHVHWPVHWTSQVHAPEKINRGNRLPGLGLGCYLDGRNGIIIGENTWIGPGVKIISMNHDSLSYTEYLRAPPIVIGRDCWIAANAVILPGVSLGDHTVVAAGAVVTKAFPDGNQVIGGVPAEIIKTLEDYKLAPEAES